jgi:hypothetical protein
MTEGHSANFKDRRRQADMNAVFFGLAVLAALNPKLLVIDLILARNQRPRLMFACFLLGGIGLAVAVGLVDVFVLHLDAIKTQNHSSGGLDLVLGIPLSVVGALLATNHLRIHRRRSHPPPKKPPSQLESWMLRTLHEPRYGLAVIIGLAVGRARGGGTRTRLPGSMTGPPIPRRTASSAPGRPAHRCEDLLGAGVAAA